MKQFIGWTIWVLIGIVSTALFWPLLFVWLWASYTYTDSIKEGERRARHEERQSRIREENSDRRAAIETEKNKIREEVRQQYGQTILDLETNSEGYEIYGAKEANDAHFKRLDRLRAAALTAAGYSPTIYGR